MTDQNQENQNPNQPENVSICRKTGRFVNKGFMLRLTEHSKMLVEGRKRRGNFKKRKKCTRKRRKTHRGWSYSGKKHKNIRWPKRRSSSLSSSPSHSSSTSSSPQRTHQKSTPQKSSPQRSSPQRSSLQRRNSPQQSGAGKESLTTTSVKNSSNPPPSSTTTSIKNSSNPPPSSTTTTKKSKKFGAQAADLTKWKNSWLYKQAPDEEERTRWEEEAKVRFKNSFKKFLLFRRSGYVPQGER